ncbi:hypothetical protein C5167_044129 [Papaver somniferum]|uniref:Uncharacterized protein n=1 Tax=Papaver somniferum TaxID=3469 RepID=A0A4Y7LBH2_PAPSO|nr:hypothetical protein C5167_044129 [Papaver somniferum]
MTSSCSKTMIISKCTIKPDETSTMKDLKLSVSDLPMLSCHYVQKGVLLSRPNSLSHFPALAGRMKTDSSGFLYIDCNDQGVDFIEANATHLSIRDILPPASDTKNNDVPQVVKEELFTYNGVVSYDDGTSFWNFFNTFAEITKGVNKIPKQPDFTRNYVKDSKAVLHRESILKLKSKANDFKNGYENGKTAANNPTVEISSFQSLSAQLWRSVTRARKFPTSKLTTFRMAVNCRHRLEPRIDPLYFGNAIQSFPTTVPIGELLSRDLWWNAEILNKNVRSHNHDAVVHGVEEWEKNPCCFPLGNFDGASITMGSSPRFPMYDNDFGWGRPLAARSGKANKFDGKISAFPGRDGGGSVDLEVILSPDTMSGLENDIEFMQYVTTDDML